MAAQLGMPWLTCLADVGGPTPATPHENITTVGPFFGDPVKARVFYLLYLLCIINQDSSGFKQVNGGLVVSAVAYRSLGPGFKSR